MCDVHAVTGLFNVHLVQVDTDWILCKKEIRIENNLYCSKLIWNGNISARTPTLNNKWALFQCSTLRSYGERVHLKKKSLNFPKIKDSICGCLLIWGSSLKADMWSSCLPELPDGRQMRISGEIYQFLLSSTMRWLGSSSKAPPSPQRSESEYPKISGLLLLT